MHLLLMGNDDDDGLIKELISSLSQHLLGVNNRLNQLPILASTRSPISANGTTQFTPDGPSTNMLLASSTKWSLT